MSSPSSTNWAAKAAKLKQELLSRQKGPLAASAAASASPHSNNHMQPAPSTSIPPKNSQTGTAESSRGLQTAAAAAAITTKEQGYDQNTKKVTSNKHLKASADPGAPKDLAPKPVKSSVSDNASSKSRAQKSLSQTDSVVIPVTASDLTTATSSTSKTSKTSTTATAPTKPKSICNKPKNPETRAETVTGTARPSTSSGTSEASHMQAKSTITTKSAQKQSSPPTPQAPSAMREGSTSSRIRNSSSGFMPMVPPPPPPPPPPSALKQEEGKLSRTSHPTSQKPQHNPAQLVDKNRGEHPNPRPESHAVDKVTTHVRNVAPPQAATKHVSWASSSWPSRAPSPLRFSPSGLNTSRHNTRSQLSQIVANDRDLRDWLEFTGWNDPDFRSHELRRQRRLAEIDRERAELEDEGRRDNRTRCDRAAPAYTQHPTWQLPLSPRPLRSDFSERNAGRELFSPSPERRRFHPSDQVSGFKRGHDDEELWDRPPRKMFRADSTTRGYAGSHRRGSSALNQRGRGGHRSYKSGWDSYTLPASPTRPESPRPGVRDSDPAKRGMKEAGSSRHRY